MFEFDENKSESNKNKHGIGFDTAKKLWEDPNRIEIPARWVNESRFILIAWLDHEHWTVVYTIRNKNIRIISVRKSRRDEKEIYDSLGI